MMTTIIFYIFLRAEILSGKKHFALPCLTNVNECVARTGKAIVGAMYAVLKPVNKQLSIYDAMTAVNALSRAAEVSEFRKMARVFQI